MELELQTQIDEGLHFAKDYLKDNLERSILRITFTKVDGTTRVMDCTLLSKYIGDYESKHNHTENPEVIAVWSVADKGWRSIKVINITELSVIKEYMLVNTEGPDTKAQYVGKTEKVA